jgi:hypothetical protein
MTTKQKTIGGIGYAVSEFLLMFALGIDFDDAKWPLFNSWALAHGSTARSFWPGRC